MPNELGTTLGEWQMKERRPGVAASAAFALAAVMLFSIFFDLYTFLHPMLNSELLYDVRAPIIDRFPALYFVVPNVALACLPLILCVVLYAALWPFVSGTPARPFMVAALVAALPATIYVVLAVLLPPFSAPGREFLTSMFRLIPVSNGLLGVFLAVALRRSGLFSAWVSSLALAWAGLELIIPLSIRVLVLLYGPQVNVTGIVKNYVSPAILAMFFVILGLELLALRRVSNKGIDADKAAA